MGFEALAEKYGIPERPVEQATPVTPPILEPEHNGQDRPLTWRDSTPVRELSEFVAKHKSMGILIMQSDGEPVIHFEPGLASPSAGAAAKRRWEVGCKAVDLLLAAEVDLVVMIEEGMIRLPPAKSRFFQASNPQGSIKGFDFRG